jgi:hypothetical protein
LALICLTIIIHTLFGVLVILFFATAEANISIIDPTIDAVALVYVKSVRMVARYTFSKLSLITAAGYNTNSILLYDLFKQFII